MRAWLILWLAVLFEVAGTTCMKASGGLTRPWPVIGVVVFYALSFIGLARALKSLDVGVAYAVWAGLGIVLITLIGVWLFDERLTLARTAFIVFILIGVAGLNLT